MPAKTIDRAGNENLPEDLVKKLLKPEEANSRDTIKELTDRLDSCLVSRNLRTSIRSDFFGCFSPLSHLNDEPTVFPIRFPASHVSHGFGLWLASRIGDRSLPWGKRFGSKKLRRQRSGQRNIEWQRSEKS